MPTRSGHGDLWRWNDEDEMSNEKSTVFIALYSRRTLISAGYVQTSDFSLPKSSKGIGSRFAEGIVIASHLAAVVLHNVDAISD
jgi:hypothetical protein